MLAKRTAPILLALVALGHCAPASKTTPLQARDDGRKNCVLSGWVTEQEYITYGPDGSDADTNGDQGISVQYEGGAGLYNTNSINPIAMGKNNTISASDTGLPHDLSWVGDYKLFNFVGCSAGYNGKVYTGTPAPSQPTPGVGYSGDSQECNVTFPCIAPTPTPTPSPTKPVCDGSVIIGTAMAASFSSCVTAAVTSKCGNLIIGTAEAASYSSCSTSVAAAATA